MKPVLRIYCRHQGHLVHVGTIKKRDEEHRKRKELEVEKKGKNNGEQTQVNQKKIQQHDSTETEISN